MSFRRTANALVSKSAIDFDEWMEELRQQHEGAVSKDYVGRIAKDVLRKCDPKQYLLSHATIVASVDVYQPKGATTGRKLERGVQIDVRYPDYRIKPACQKIINNNGDAWERSLLLSTYKTFIAAPNYLEHIQIPELSKGFIVDAIARDLGETCYIDILVATDRKHQMLVRDIMAGNISAMSMGCISLFTTCTHCGNVAADDTQLCPCIMYGGKNTLFTDSDGVEHRLAELIGHVSVPNSNQFIEASWVRNPAFSGAQRRNILNPEVSSPSLAFDLSRVVDLSQARLQAQVPDGVGRAASRLAADDDGQGGSQDQGGSPPSGDPSTPDDPSSPDDSGSAAGGKDDPPSPPKDDSPKPSGGLDDLIGKAQEMLLEGLVKGLGERLAPKPEDVPSATPSLSEANMNETLLTGSSRLRSAVDAIRTSPALTPEMRRFALRAARAVAGGRRGVASARLTPRDLVVFSWIADTAVNSAHPPAIYQAAMSTGASSSFPSERSYLTACGQRLGRRPAPAEAEKLARLGRVASLADSF